MFRFSRSLHQPTTLGACRGLIRRGLATKEVTATSATSSSGGAHHGSERHEGMYLIIYIICPILMNISMNY